MRLKTVCYVIPDALDEHIRHLARERNTSASEIVRIALMTRFGIEKPRPSAEDELAIKSGEVVAAVD